MAVKHEEAKTFSPKTPPKQDPSKRQRMERRALAAEQRHLNRFDLPKACVSYTRYGRPFMGVPEQAPRRIVRHNVEADTAAENERIAHQSMQRPNGLRHEAHNQFLEAHAHRHEERRAHRRSVSTSSSAFYTSADHPLLPRTRTCGDLPHFPAHSLRHAARLKYEADYAAKNSRVDEGIDYRMQRDACEHTRQVAMVDNDILCLYPHGAPRYVVHKQMLKEGTRLPGLDFRGWEIVS